MKAKAAHKTKVVRRPPPVRTAKSEAVRRSIERVFTRHAAAFQKLA